MSKLPRAILFDLDDTILVAFGPAQSQWRRTTSQHSLLAGSGPIEAEAPSRRRSQAASTELWADPGAAPGH